MAIEVCIPDQAGCEVCARESGEREVASGADDQAAC